MSTKTKDEVEVTADGDQPKKGKKKKLIIIALVLVLVAGAGYWFFLKPSGGEAESSRLTRAGNTGGLPQRNNGRAPRGGLPGCRALVVRPARDRLGSSIG